MAKLISSKNKIKPITDILSGEYRGYGEVEVEIPEGITNIRSYAFEDCPNLEIVYCPKSLKRIDEKAFYDCPKLKEVILQDDGQIVPSHNSTFGCNKIRTIPYTWRQREKRLSD